MNCEYASSRLTQFLLDELSKVEHREIASHIETCTLCSQKIVQERERINSIGSLSQTSAVRPEFREKLLNAVHIKISLIEAPATKKFEILIKIGMLKLIIAVSDKTKRINTEV